MVGESDADPALGFRGRLLEGVGGVNCKSRIGWGLFQVSISSSLKAVHLDPNGLIDQVVASLDDRYSLPPFLTS